MEMLNQFVWRLTEQIIILKKASKAKGALGTTVFPHPMPIPGIKIVVSLQIQAYVGNLNKLHMCFKQDMYGYHKVNSGLSVTNTL